MHITQNRRAWIVGSALVAVVIMLAGWFTLISPTMADASSLRSRRGEVELQNDLLRAKITKLKTQNDNLTNLKQDLLAAVQGLPNDAGLAELTTQASAQSKLAGVTLSGITFGSPTPLVASGTTARPAAGRTASGALYTISVTMTSVGPAARQYEFLRMLQHVGPRRVLITSTNLTPATGSQVASIDASATMVAVMTVFSEPTTPAQQAQLEKLLANSGS